MSVRWPPREVTVCWILNDSSKPCRSRSIRPTPKARSPTTIRPPSTFGAIAPRSARNGAAPGRSIGRTARRYRTTNAPWRSRSRRARVCAGSRRLPSGRTGRGCPSFPIPRRSRMRSGRVIGAINVLIDAAERNNAEAAGGPACSDRHFVGRRDHQQDAARERSRPGTRARSGSSAIGRRNDRREHPAPHSGRVAGRRRADHLPAEGGRTPRAFRNNTASGKTDAGSTSR